MRNTLFFCFFLSFLSSPLSGGASRDRTDDPLLAKQVLSQLSYGPFFSALLGASQLSPYFAALHTGYNFFFYFSRRDFFDSADLVGLGRLELPTSPLSGVRSNHLSYRPSRLLCLLIFRCSSSLSSSQAISGGTFVSSSLISFKEVIQPQVPLRLPCYDFTPVMNHTVVSVPPKVKLPTSGTTHSHGVTGGVYKARERIHRDILIRDY